MKWTLLIPTAILLTSCAYTNRDISECQSVRNPVHVTPIYRSTPVYRLTPVYRVTPIYNYSCVFYKEPVDVNIDTTDCE